MHKFVLKYFFLLLGCILLASCGSSPGGGRTSAVITPPTPAPTPKPVEYNTREYRNNYGLDQIHAIVAYDKGATGKGITVAVIDSGIDIDNSQIMANIHVDSTNIVTGRKSDLNDLDGHGTGVAGVIAAIRDPFNNTNVNTHGVAFEAKIMAINAADTGSCSGVDGCSFLDYDIAAALDYARVRGVKIVNISLGGDGFNNLVLVNAYKRAVNAGMVIILAAGNRDKTDTDLTIAQPENSAAVAWEPWANGQIILAGGVDSTSTIGDFSHRAGEVAKNVFLVAGGLDILSLGLPDKNGVEQFFNWTGTSFSAPHIAGAAALLMNAFPNLTGKQVADLLLQTATDLGAVGPDVIYGRGLVNLEEAFKPKGTTSIAVRNPAGETRTVSLTGSVLLGGGAFGGFAAFSNVLSSSLMLDGYNRSYRVDLGQNIFKADKSLYLTPMIESSRGSRTSSLRLNRSAEMQLSWQEDWRFQEVEENYFSYQNKSRNRYHNLRMKLDISLGEGKSAQNITFSQGLSLKEAMEDYDQNAFLTIGKEDFTALMGRSDSQSFIYSYLVSPQTKFAMATQHGGQGRRQYGLRSDRYLMMARLDHYVSNHVKLGLDLGVMEEKGSVLGSMSAGAIDLGKGAATGFINARFDWSFVQGMTFFTKASYGRTHVRAAGLSLVERINKLTSGSFSIGVMGRSLIQDNDRLSFAVSQPLRVMGGTADVSYVARRDYQTDSLSFIRHQISLAPSGREIDFELAYSIADILGARVDFNILHQINPNHNNLSPSNTGFLVRFGSEF